MISTAKYANHANAIQAGPRERGNLKRRRFPPHPNPLPHRDGGEGEWFRVFRVVRGSSVGWHGYNAGNGNWSTHNYYHADGNGNITYLMTAAQGLGASYRYDAYGNTLSSSGTYASANTYRFSSKEQHERSGLYYYGYRFYSPNWQRWLNRDPLGEPGFELVQRIAPFRSHPYIRIPAEIMEGPNLYAYVANNPILLVDPYGLSFWGRVGNGLTGAATGAGTGALTGAGVGAGIGALGAGVGAGPGAVAGAGAGAIAGAIGGFVAGVLSDPCFKPGKAAGTGALNGGLAGLTGGAGAVGGVGWGIAGGAVAGGTSAGLSTGGDPYAIGAGAFLGGGFGGLGAVAGDLGEIGEYTFYGTSEVVGQDVGGYMNLFTK
ncbi:MAG: RHS repeat-associated core domain-containing protein [Verrucomicrobiae bacterium]|nr:RHS repeat-associated core domain-containing protein [Verrucomicrobiae bacterium]